MFRLSKANILNFTKEKNAIKKRPIANFVDEIHIYTGFIDNFRHFNIA
jgi:hypothetical protein